MAGAALARPIEGLAGPQDFHDRLLFDCVGNAWSGLAIVGFQPAVHQLGHYLDEHCRNLVVPSAAISPKWANFLDVEPERW